LIRFLKTWLLKNTFSPQRHQVTRQHKGRKPIWLSWCGLCLRVFVAFPAFQRTAG
jgi:hypothetical protein